MKLQYSMQIHKSVNTIYKVLKNNNNKTPVKAFPN